MRTWASLNAPEQANLPTGPTHVAARGTLRTDAQRASARKFMAAAGKVPFDLGQATLKAVWDDGLMHSKKSRVQARPRKA